MFSVVLAAAVLASALGAVLSQHASRSLFVEIQSLESKQDDLNEEWGRLQLEQSTWATDDRIEMVARTSIGMHQPGNDSRILIH